MIRNTGAECVLVINNGLFGNYNCAVYNEGHATLNGGTYTGRTCSSCTSYWDYTIKNINVESYMIINGGTFTGTQGAVSASIGTLIVNDGQFKSVHCVNNSAHTAIFYALYAAGEYGEVRCIINGGTFETEGKNAAVVIGNDNTGGDGGINAQATAEIYGGTFIAPEGVPAIKGATKTGDPIIFGGSFTSEVSSLYLISGYECVKEGNYFVVREMA